MTPEQCHPIYCNPQHVEGSDGWDRHSSSNLHKQQMDGQNEGNGRIYNQRGLTKKGIAIRKTLEGPSCVVSEEEKKNSSSDEARWQTFTPPLRRWRSCLTVDEVLTKARFLSPLLYQIHCIGPVGFGFAHTYSEGPPESGPYSYIFKISPNSHISKGSFPFNMILATILLVYNFLKYFSKLAS